MATACTQLLAASPNNVIEKWLLGCANQDVIGILHKVQKQEYHEHQRYGK